MSTYTNIIYHIIFGTKNHAKTLTSQNKEQLYKYIWGIIQNKNSHLYRIGGIENHLHILASLHPSISVADFIRELKVNSSKWIKEEHLFPLFDGWQKGYSVFSVSESNKNNLIEYIKNQEEHHKKKSFTEEWKEFLDKNGIKYNERYIIE